MLATTSAIAAPVFAADVELVTGLDRVTAAKLINATRGLHSREPVGWPRDPMGTARDLIRAADDIDNKVGNWSPIPGRGSAVEQLAAALSASYARRMAANAREIDADCRQCAAIVAAGRRAGLDAEGDASRAVAERTRIESSRACGLDNSVPPAAVEAIGPGAATTMEPVDRAGMLIVGGRR